MKKLPLDLSKFKKVHEDDNSAKLQHPDGHHILIAKKALSSKMKSDLESMPQHLADGGETESNVDVAPQALEQAINYFRGQNAPAPVQSQQQFNMEKEANAPQFNMEKEANQKATHMDQSPQVIAQEQPPQNQPFAMPNLTPEQQQMIENNPYMAQSFASGATNAEGLGEQLKGIHGEANATGNMARAQMAALSMANKKNEELQNFQSDNYNFLQNELNNFSKDHAIDPKDYEKHMGTGETIRTMIGLVLGGAFSGMTGQANPVSVMLQNRINENINAQQSNKDSLFNALKQKFGNFRDASDMLKSYNLTAASNEFQKAGLSAQDPLAQARALQASGALKRQASDVVGQIAARQAMLKMQTSGAGTPGQIDPMTSINFMVPPQDQAKAKDELVKYQNDQQLRNTALAQFDQATKEATIAQKIGRKLEESSAQGGLKNTLGLLLKDKEGKINTEVLNNLVESTIPKTIHSQEEIAKNRQNFQMFMNLKDQYPTLQYYGIVPKTQTVGPSNIKLGPLK